MRKGIATVCLSGTLEQKMKASSAAGFDGIEIFENDLMTSARRPAEVKAMAADLGITLDLYQPFRDFESVTDDLLQTNLRRASAKFKLMNQLGMDLILVCSNVATASIDDDDVATGQLRQLAELGADHGIRIAYEALAWGTYVNDFEHAARLVEAVDHPNLGTCLDSFHILSRQWDSAPIEEIAAGKIFFCQLADAPQLSMDVLSWSRHHRVFPGEGQFELTKFMAHLVRAGYAGPVSLEVFNDVFRQSDPARTAVDAMRSLIWLEEQTAHYLAENDAGSPKYAMDLATLPRVEEPSGFNFAEVKTDAPEEVELLLGQLGFGFDGRHRTKPVQLWSQGQARIIVNELDAGQMEPAIAALGFDVASPMQASSRAQQLKAPVVSRQSQANEEILQAVSAPDSTEIFLCQSSPDGTAAWTVEFGDAQARAMASTAAEGVFRIDHVNLSQPWQHFDEAVLFYESTMSLKAQPSLDVPSPNGLVRSQVMRTVDGSVRLALNVAPLSLVVPIENASVVPSYPEHIAFSTNDLIAVARAAKKRGLAFLTIPENYYEDIDARFDLDPKLLGTLRELNLLYDRDQLGEFLHFYTATVGSVFFEVVERRGGYEGYGAPNAPVRLAVQYERNQSRRSVKPS